MLSTASDCTTNSHGRPATFIEIIVASGNARPMPSASSTFSPRRAAHPTGATPLLPPISAAMSAVTVRPLSRSTSATMRSGCHAAESISMPTLGAPIADMMSTASSGPSSPTWSSSTGPCSSIAISTANCTVCTAPPPPVPKIAAPAARGATSSRSIVRRGVRATLSG